MMAEKARLFKDEETLEMIMQTEDPFNQKKLGRLVDNFDKEIWEEAQENFQPYCWNVVWRGNMAKFSQSQFLLDELLATKGTTIVEASAEDTIWGIGLAETDPGAFDRDTWQGTNWLGEVLTNIRCYLEKNPKRFTQSKEMQAYLGA